MHLLKKLQMCVSDVHVQVPQMGSAWRAAGSTAPPARAACSADALGFGTAPYMCYGVGCARGFGTSLGPWEYAMALRREERAEAATVSNLKMEDFDKNTNRL